MKKTTIQLGQSLFEVLIAVFLVSIVMVSLVALSTQSLSNSTLSKSNTLAIRYSEEGLEWLRSERDNDWTTFVSKADASGTYCLMSLSWTTGGSHSGSCSTTEVITNTVFTREVKLDHSGDVNTVNVQVITSWTDGKGKHTSQISGVLTNWNNR